MPLMTQPPPRSTLFPYTTLFRSSVSGALAASGASSASGASTPSASGATVGASASATGLRSEEHTSELQSRQYLVCRLLREDKNRTLGHPETEHKRDLWEISESLI